MPKLKSPLISIIVPIYNVEKYLDVCLESIINQTYQNIEIILIDDGSTDGSGKLCDDYLKKDSRIKVIRQKNGGLSAARNSGIKVAKGKYLTFIDSDDYVAANYVEVLLNLLQDTNSEISSIKPFILYPDRTIDTGSGKTYTLSRLDALDKLLYDDDFGVSTWGKLYNSKLFKSVRFPVGQLFEDAATTYLLVDQCEKISVKSVSLYYYIIRPDSITNNAFSEKKLDLIKSTKSMTDYLSKKYPSLKSACERRLMYAYLSTLSQLTKSKHPSKKYINQLMPYIKDHRKSVLKNPRLPRRDRFALHLTKFGFTGFRFAWDIYSKLTRRK